MVKKWIIILIVSAALIVGCILEGKYVNKAFDEIIDDLYVYQDMLENSGDNVDSQANIDFIDDLHDEFHKLERALKMLIWHTGLKDVEVGMSRILTYVEENNKTEALVETHALIDYCEHYSLDFQISAENIF